MINRRLILYAKPHTLSFKTRPFFKSAQVEALCQEMSRKTRGKIDRVLMS